MVSYRIISYKDKPHFFLERVSNRFFFQVYYYQAIKKMATNSLKVAEGHLWKTIRYLLRKSPGNLLFFSKIKGDQSPDLKVDYFYK